MKPYYQDDHVTLYHGDCRQVLAALPEASIDAIVTDPPYELGFMGKGWDASGIAYSAPMWAEVLRVLKPGGHLLAFGGTRTWHRMVVAIEDAGFEIRDELAWLYGSGFPKSLDVSKAIDKAAGAEREVVGSKITGRANAPRSEGRNEVDCAGGQMVVDLTVPATAEAEQWNGWGTALKPAHEPICLARKPLDGTVAANVLAHGTGALNIDGCRISLREDEDPERLAARSGGVRGFADQYVGGTAKGAPPTDMSAGRWPANVVLDDTAAAMLDAQSGTTTSGAAGRKGASGFVNGYESGDYDVPYGDTGGASRFFYVAKAAQHERPKIDGKGHATVKPVALMRWLVRLVTPPGGLVLDPFAGTGTTAEAAIVEGFRCTLIEAEADHLPLIEARLAKPIAPTLFGGGL